MDDKIFEVIDKTSRKIRLTKRQWMHITIKHTDLSNKEKEIIDALENPDIILGHRFDEMAGNYYKYDKIEKAYLVVSAKYLNGEGFVITSFYTRHIKKK